MARFHIDSSLLQGDLVLLNDRESHHAISVLRMKVGDTLELFDGAGRNFKGVITEIKQGRVAVALDLNVHPQSQPLIDVTLAISVIKQAPMDLLIQKTAELGVTALMPLITDRTIVKVPKERWQSKVARWQKIALESCKQCGRSQVPSIGPVQPLFSFCGDLSAYDTILVATLARKGETIFNAIKEKPLNKGLVFIGPEGDFTSREVDQLISRGATPVSLGPLIMRSETAALYMTAALHFYLTQIRENT